MRIFVRECRVTMVEKLAISEQPLFHPACPSMDFRSDALATPFECAESFSKRPKTPYSHASFFSLGRQGGPEPQAKRAHRRAPSTCADPPPADRGNLRANDRRAWSR